MSALKKTSVIAFLGVQAALLVANGALPPVLAEHIDAVTAIEPPQLVALLVCGMLLMLDSAFVGRVIYRLNPTGRTGLPLWFVCVALSTFVALWFGCGSPPVLPFLHWSSCTIWVVSSVAIFVPAGITFLIPQAKKSIPAMYHYIYNRK